MALNEYLALTLVAATAIVASIAIWAILISNRTRGREPIPLEPRRPAPWSLVDLVLVLMAYALFLVLGRVLLRDVWHINLPTDAQKLEPEHLTPVQLGSMAATLATLLFAVALVSLRVGARAADLGISLRRLRYDAWIGLVGFLALAAPVYGLQAVLVHFFPVQHPLIELIEAQPDNATFFIVGLSVSLVAPVCEEFFMRVLVQGWLERVVAEAVPGSFPQTARAADHAAPIRIEPNADSASENPYAAPQTASVQAERTSQADYRGIRAIPIVTSALVFALLHVGHGPAPIPLFFLALGLGYVYQRTHRLWPSVIMHFLLNTSSLAMLWVTTG